MSKEEIIELIQDELEESFEELSTRVVAAAVSVYSRLVAAGVIE